MTVQPYAFLSAVPFVDVDFHFARLAPFAKFRFAQTNHRVYVIDRHTNQHVVWFFGTTLGSRVVHLAQTAWRIPWHYARYQVDCALDETTGQYTRFQYRATCDWCETEIDITHDKQAVGIPPGFTSMDEANLVLTHPVQGFYFRRDGYLGGYRVWHDVIPMTTGSANHLYFSLYEHLGILSREEMQTPHSIFICPEIEFDIYLPPKVDRSLALLR